MKTLIIPNNKFQREQGQVALIVLLISAVVMTLGLSLSKKVTTETKIDTNEELSKQSFNAAESGIDTYLSTNGTVKTYTSTNKDSRADVSSWPQGGGNVVDLKTAVDPNKSGFFWLANRDPTTEMIDTSVKRFNGNNLMLRVSDNFSGSLSLALYYFDSITSTYKVNRLGYNFSGSPGVSNYYGPISPNKIDISTILCPAASCTRLLLVVTPLFKSTPLVAWTTDSLFPVQGEDITSVGTAGNLANGVTTKVSEMKGYEVPDFLLDAVSANNVLSN